MASQRIHTGFSLPPLPPELLGREDLPPQDEKHAFVITAVFFVVAVVFKGCEILPLKPTCVCWVEDTLKSQANQTHYNALPPVTASASLMLGRIFRWDGFPLL